MRKLRKGVKVFSGLALACLLPSCGGSSGVQGTVGLREQTVAADMVRIRVEIAENGGLDQWWARLQPFRDALVVKTSEVVASGFVFVGTDGQYLFMPRNLAYMSAADLLYAEPDNPASGFSPAYKAIVGLDDQLRARGIDLIVVPVPGRGEMYPEKIIPGTDPRLSVTPHRTEMIQALMEAGVEVVDLKPLFIRMRDVVNRSLYMEADPHWGGPAIDLAAGELAWRLGRYPELAPEGTRGYTSTPTLSEVTPFLLDLLPPDVSETYVAPPIIFDQIRDLSGELYQGAPDSPILVVGDSAVGMFAMESGGLAAHIALHFGAPVAGAWLAGGGPFVPQILADQGPDFINRRRVIIWVFVSHFMAVDYRDSWVAVDLP